MNNKFSKNKFVSTGRIKKENPSKESLIARVCEIGGNNPDSPEVSEIFGRMTKRELNAIIRKYEESVKSLKSIETTPEM